MRSCYAYATKILTFKNKKKRKIKLRTIVCSVLGRRSCDFCVFYKTKDQYEKISPEMRKIIMASDPLRLLGGW